jgi:hypothetical protein
MQPYFLPVVVAVTICLEEIKKRARDRLAIFVVDAAAQRQWDAGHAPLAEVLPLR